MTKDELLINNMEDGNNKLRIWKQDEYINIEGINYIHGMPIELNAQYIKLGTNYIRETSMSNCTIGIRIY